MYGPVSRNGGWWAEDAFSLHLQDEPRLNLPKIPKTYSPLRPLEKLISSAHSTREDSFIWKLHCP